MRHPLTRVRAVPTADGFITWRGIMTRVLCAPYDRSEWEFAVCRIGAHIYLCEFKEGPDAFANSAHERTSYWGFKFEQLVTLASREPIPWEKRRRAFSAPVNNIEEFCSVVKTRLGAHRLVLGAEIDCAGARLCHGARARAHSRTARRSCRAGAASRLH